MSVKLQNVRLSFSALFVAEQYQGAGPFKFRASFLFDKTQPCYAELDAAVEQVAREKWGAKATALIPAIKSDRRMCCLWDGNLKPDWNGYPGKWALVATNEERPIVVDRNKAALTAADGKPYDGCYVNATVELWAQDNQFGKAVRASLRTVTFLRDGDAFGGGTAITADEIEDVTDGADADDVV